MSNGLIFKIEIYYDQKKRKHKLYETRVAYEKWWEYHAKDAAFFNTRSISSGLVGYVDGKVDRTYGIVPEKCVREDHAAD